MSASPAAERNKQHEHLIDQIKLRDDRIRELKAELATALTLIDDILKVKPQPRLPIELMLRIRTLEASRATRRSRPRG